MADSERERQFTKKKQFFDQIYSLDGDEEDNLEDHGRQDSVAMLRRHNTLTDHIDHSTNSKTPSRTLAKAGEGRQRLPRSVSNVTMASTNKATKATTERPPKPIGLERTSLLATDTVRRQQNSRLSLTSSAPLKLVRKRKRDPEVNMMPEAQRIFRGLHIFFFPNSDAHPARRLRIAKALEFGATWQRQWNDTVTHVVVDKAIDYSLILKFLHRDRLPEQVVVVNEVWPADCIAYRALIDHEAVPYRALGHNSTAIVGNSRAVSDAALKSERSLELKAAGAAVKVRPTQTPETTTDSCGSADASKSGKRSLDIVVAPSEAIDLSESCAPVSTAADAFEAAVQQARQLQNLPLEDEDDDSRPVSSDGPSAESSDAENSALVKSNGKTLAYQDKFQCMQSHAGNRKEGPNAGTIEILQQMADYYGKMGDEWRLRAYRKAIATLRNHSVKITTKQEALALPHVGNRLAEKIEEIAYTNRLRRLENVRAEPSDKILQTFMGVYGVGFQQASRWVKQGYSTLDELLLRADLSANQRIGVEHYSDFKSRIPRAEVEQHGNIVRTSVLELDAQFMVIIGGSYRRGAEDSGDIDCIISRPNKPASYIRSLVFDRLVPMLFRKGFLKASLAASSRDEGSKWHGASALPSSTIWRRIDFLLVPEHEMGAALLYFTGDDIFNRSMRLLASYKGMRLNQHGLYRDVLRGKGRVKLTEGTLVEGKDERRIFQLLGVPWRPPEERVC